MWPAVSNTRADSVYSAGFKAALPIPAAAS